MATLELHTVTVTLTCTVSAYCASDDERARESIRAHVEEHLSRAALAVEDVVLEDDA